MPDYELDQFEITPKMSSYSFGFVISQLSEVNITNSADDIKTKVKVWGRPDFHNEISVK